MIRTIAGDFGSESLFQNTPFAYGQDGTQVRSDFGTNTQIVQAPSGMFDAPPVSSDVSAPVQPVPIVAGTYVTIVDGVVTYVGDGPEPTASPTSSPTSSVTPTVTPTSSVTPTVTPTSSVTPTVTPTSSVTPTVTPTSSVTPTSTPPPAYSCSLAGFCSADSGNGSVSVQIPAGYENAGTWLECFICPPTATPTDTGTPSTTPSPTSTPTPSSTPPP